MTTARLAADLTRVCTDQAVAAEAADWDAVSRYDALRAELLHALANARGDPSPLRAALRTAQDCAERVERAFAEGERSLREQMRRATAGEKAARAYRMQG